MNRDFNFCFIFLSIDSSIALHHDFFSCFALKTTAEGRCLRSVAAATLMKPHASVSAAQSIVATGDLILERAEQVSRIEPPALLCYNDTKIRFPYAICAPGVACKERSNVVFRTVVS